MRTPVDLEFGALVGVTANAATYTTSALTPNTVTALADLPPPLMQDLPLRPGRRRPRPPCPDPRRPRPPCPDQLRRSPRRSWRSPAARPRSRALRHDRRPGVRRRPFPRGG